MSSRALSHHVAEALESRVMLAGDHPSLPVGPTPWPATAVSFDFISPTGSPDFGRGSVTGTISTGDTGDLFTFTMPTIGQGGNAKDFVTILADTVNSPGSTLDSMVEVYDAAGTLITTGRSNTGVSIGVTTNPTLPRTPDGWAGFEGTAGATYFVRVRADTTIGTGRTATGDYRLRIDSVTIPIALDSVSTDNDVIGTGRETANITFAQDEVVYRITTPNDSRFDTVSALQATSLDITTPQVNPHLDFYSAGNALGVVTQLVGDQDSGRQTDAFAVVRTAKSTTYYLRVRADDFRVGGSGSLGAFTAFVRMAAPTIDIDPVTRLGDTEPELIQGPDLTAGTPLDGAGMRLFRFVAQGSGQGIITAIGGGLIPNVDGVVNPAIRLFDSNGNSIDFNKATASTAQIQTPLIGGQTYYIVAEGFDSIADTGQNTRDGSVRIFVEAHHTFNPDPANFVDDHADNPGPGGFGTLPLWQEATPIRFGEPRQVTDVWTQPGQTPVVETERQDHSFIQTGTAQGRLNRPGDSDLFQFTPPLSQLSDFTGDFTRVTPNLFVGGNFATAGTNRVDGTGAKRNNVAIWDLGDWFDSGPRDMRDAGNNLLDGPIDGPIFAQKVWDPDGQGPYQPVLAVAGQFQNVWSLVPNAQGILENRVVPANVAFRTFYPPENRFIWSTSIGYRLVPGTTRYTTVTDPISIQNSGPILALETFDAAPNVPGQTGAGPDELFLGGNFTFTDPNDPMIVFNSLAQVQFRPNPAMPDQGAIALDNMGGGVLSTTAGNTNGIVRAFTVFDPPAPALETNPAPMMPPNPAQPDAPAGLYIGGLFASADQPDGVTPARTTATNVIRYGKREAGDNNANVYFPLGHQLSRTAGPANPNSATPSPADQGVTTTIANNNGGVYTMVVMDAPGGEFTPAPPWGPDDVAAQDIPTRLYIGGGFTRTVLRPQADPGGAVSNLVSYDGNNFYPVSNVPSVAQGTAQWVGIVRTMAVWRATTDLQTTGADPVLVVGADNGPILAGQRFASTGIIRVWQGQQGAPMQWGDLATTLDGTVLTLAVAEENEPATSAPYEQLYLGGTFTTIQVGANPPITGLNRIARFTQFNPATNQWQLAFSELTSGVTGLSDPPPATETVTAVYSLGLFNDQPVGQVRHNSRPGTRTEIRLNRTDDSQETVNLQVNVYDSNFNLIYNNDAIGNTADPAGANNPALGFTNFIMPESWAGEVYYVEVVGGGTGRYTLSVTTEALPPKDPNAPNDGIYADTFSTITKPVGEGEFSTAPQISIDATGFGKNFQINPNSPIATGRVPRPGDPMAPFDPDHPDSFTSRFYIPDVNGDVRYVNEDPATISVPNETHLFQFRAPNDGTAEIRIATKQIQVGWSEQLIAELTPGRPFSTSQTLQNNPNTKVKTLNSPLHAALRVFTNDQSTGQFVQTGFSNENPAVGGFADAIPANGGGNFTPGDTNQRVFQHEDPRIVIPVRRGNVYFVQVESAFRELFASDPSLVDWRFATGAYELSIRATPSLNGIDDFVNGVPAGGGSFNPTFLNDSSIIVDPVSGQGSITGQIVNVTTGPFLNPNDSDVFRWYAHTRGTVSVTLTPGAGLTPRVEVVAADGSRPAVGIGAGPGQPVTVSFSVAQGDPIFFVVSGVAGTQGDYTLSVNAPGLTDDQPFSDATAIDNLAPVTGWANAKPLSLNRAFGVYGLPDPSTGSISQAAGNIENPADQDIFRFTAEAFEVATITVERVDNSLDPFVRVYERSVDADGRDIFLLIAVNDDNVLDPPNARTTFSTTPGREYFAIVSGVNLDDSFGRYNMRVNVIPTDDHPNRIDFPSATTIALSLDAINLTAAGSVNGTIERTDDKDLFRFIAPTNGEVSVTVSRRNSSTLKIGVTLLSAANAGLPSGVSYSFGANGTVTVRFNQLVQGTEYFILVEPDVPGAGETQTGEYFVAINTNTIDDFPNAGQFNLAQNIPLSGADNSGSLNGIVVPTTDSDLFKFTTLVNGTATIRVTTPGSGFSPRVLIFNAALAQTQAVNGNGDTASVSFSVSSGQLYYILVLANTGATGSAVTGDYNVAVTNTISGIGGPDDFPNQGEWNDAFNIALDANTGRGSVNGVVNSTTDTDLFTFTTAGAGPVDIQLSVPAGSALDGTIEIYDSSRTLIFSDAVGIGGSTAAISFNAAAGTQFFILVRPAGGSTGAYTLRVASVPLTSIVYYPEGFRGNNIDEFINVVNSNNFPVTYQIFARYELGDNPNTPLLINGQSTLTVPANTRTGVKLSGRGDVSLNIVRPGVGYAVEIRSSAPLGASFSHFDFGATVGENFTDTTSTTWTFAQVNKDAANYRDFLLFYNPGNATGTVTVEYFYADGTTGSFSNTLEGLRRGGLNINNEGRLPRTGSFGVRVTSTVPIVASLTSYNLPRNGGDGQLGEPSSGGTRGALPGIRNDAGVFGSFAFVNTNSTTATINLVASYSRIDLPQVVRTITVAPHASFTADFASLGLIPGQNAGFAYSSNVAVTFSAFEYQLGDANFTATASSAARAFLFSDLTLDPTQAGTNYIQRLSLYNPTANAITVAGTLIFTNGTTSAVSISVPAQDFAFLQLDQQPAILSRAGAGLVSYGLQLTATQPFVSSVLSYDLLLAGGFSSLGQPIGLTTPLSSIVTTT